jgi:hypothetical protein
MLADERRFASPSAMPPRKASIGAAWSRPSILALIRATAAAGDGVRRSEVCTRDSAANRPVGFKNSVRLQIRRFRSSGQSARTARGGDHLIASLYGALYKEGPGTPAARRRSALRCGGTEF